MQNKHHFFWRPNFRGGGQGGWDKNPSISKNPFWGLPWERCSPAYEQIIMNHIQATNSLFTNFRWQLVAEEEEETRICEFEKPLLQNQSFVAISTLPGLVAVVVVAVVAVVIDPKSDHLRKTGQLKITGTSWLLMMSFG